VNCAVTITTGAKLIDMPIDAIQREIGTNILGNFYTIKEFLPDMLRLERGHIVTISSALGFMGPARLSIPPRQTLPFPLVFAFDVLSSSSLFSFLYFYIFFFPSLRRGTNNKAPTPPPRQPSSLSTKA